MPATNTAKKVAALAKAAPRASRPATGTDTVTFACKHPPGLLLRVFEPSSKSVPIIGKPGQMEQQPVGRAIGDPFLVFGPATPFGERPRALIVGGYAMTPGVPRELAETWMEQNKDSAMVRNRLVFISKDKESFEDEAEELTETRSGFEPIDTSTTLKRVGRNQVEVPNDPRWPRSIGPNLTVVASDARE